MNEHILDSRDYGDKNYVPASARGISVAIATHNLIYYGYPFVESLLTIEPVADEIVIMDFESIDGTLEVLEQLQKKYPKIKIYHLPIVRGGYWKNGWGTWKQLAMNMCYYRFVLLLDIDEIYSSELLKEVWDWKLNMKDMGFSSVMNDITYNCLSPKFIHITKDFKCLESPDAYHHAIRIAPNSLAWSVEWDGWQITSGFDKPIVYTSEKPIWHFHGLCFPLNALRRDLIRMYYYHDGGHIAQAEKSRAEIDKGYPAEPIKRDLEVPDYVPEIIKPLVGYDRYFVRKELLE